MHTKRIILIALLVLAAVGSGIFATRLSYSPPLTDMLRTCIDSFKPEPRRDTCLKIAVQLLLSRVSTEDLMGYIVASTTPEAIVGRCHEIAHVIGQESLIRNGSLDDTLASCTPQCAFGCTHGVIAAEVARSYGETYPGDGIEH
ncbi:MAG: hypothetical protein AAB288_01185, partial [Acidobacteriota bacterium]